MKSILLIFVILLFTSCEYIDELTTTSETISKEITIGSIQKLTVNCACEITLTNNHEDTILVIGQEHLIKDLTITSEDENTIIDHLNRNYLPKNKLIKIETNAKLLNTLILNHIIQVNSNDTITSNDFSLTVNGRGRFSECNLCVKNNNIRLMVYGDSNIANLNLSGTSNTLKITLEGASNLFAEYLESKVITVLHRSIGQCYVNSTESIDVKTYSTGNTYYVGNPSYVNQTFVEIPNLTPSGQLIQLTE